MNCLFKCLLDIGANCFHMCFVSYRFVCGGAGADNPLVERAQKIHLVNQIHIGLYNKGL